MKKKEQLTECIATIYARRPNGTIHKVEVDRFESAIGDYGDANHPSAAVYFSPTSKEFFSYAYIEDVDDCYLVALAGIGHPEPVNETPYPVAEFKQQLNNYIETANPKILFRIESSYNEWYFPPQELLPIFDNLDKNYLKVGHHAPFNYKGELLIGKYLSGLVGHNSKWNFYKMNEDLSLNYKQLIEINESTSYFPWEQINITNVDIGVEIACVLNSHFAYDYEGYDVRLQWLVPNRTMEYLIENMFKPLLAEKTLITIYPSHKNILQPLSIIYINKSSTYYTVLDFTSTRNDVIELTEKLYEVICKLIKL